MAPATSTFGVIPGEGGPDGPGDPNADPLAEAFVLAERAKTPRERLRALEQVRAATKLRLRDVAEPDPGDRDLLDQNIAAAESAYRHAPDFETAARALSGWREALLARIHAHAGAAGDTIELEVPRVVFTDLDGSNPSEAPRDDKPRKTYKVPLKSYFSGVPKKFHDVTKYHVQHIVRLSLGDDGSHTPRSGTPPACSAGGPMTDVAAAEARISRTLRNRGDGAAAYWQAAGRARFERELRADGLDEDVVAAILDKAERTLGLGDSLEDILQAMRERQSWVVGQFE